MNKFSETFTRFMNKTIKSLLFFVLIGSLGIMVANIIGFSKSTIVYLIVSGISIFMGYRIFKLNIPTRKRLLLILIMGFMLRILWLLNMPSVPSSDFKLIYDSSIKFLKGDTSMFRGTAYIARFPHLTMMVLYTALINFLFPLKSLLVIKIINLLFGLVDIILLYLLGDIIFKNKKYAQFVAFIAAIFPPFITYTSVLCTENIAIPFYLLSMYIFIHYSRNKKSKFQLLICGIILSVGNLFRTTAMVVLIAYVIYIGIYFLDSIYEKLKDIVILVTSYLLIMIIVSTTLQSLNITERQLWNAREPKITSTLKGSNYKAFGRWNEEDAKFIEEHINNYDELQEKSKEIILDRFRSNSVFKTIIFLLGKFTLQWSVGDFEGYVWAQMDVPEDQIKFPIKKEGTLAIQLIYTLIMLLVFIGLSNKNLITKIKEVNLFYLILGGYGIAYLFVEEQGRYGYICCYVLIFLSIFGIDKMVTKFNYNLNTKCIDTKYDMQTVKTLN
ncbi:glycosyltransferase family 39 protein [Clostridium uliginosum]|uniref:Dolichyl-phosphate-mannose-protein mannosyltransferase n=1 Tax=Clostridium uliginosum TaxID=119641 RepID=A0A1I1R2F8_9CLOT|nr:glycosyltransferase family 39 protein [Clostridium uliginosum]SFD28442.1 Dolichyl-phosphate-mannose-protein mannosyltransferase [Clostridium uliginosum]